MTPLVSVIIPIFNSEKFLSECISSIVNQTYTNWELLLIDDGSTDSSPEIAEIWKVKDKRIKYFHQENRGVSSARNKGIDNAIGEYVMFVDSDDVCEPNIIKALATNFTPDVDIVCCLIHNFVDKIIFDSESYSYHTSITCNSLEEIYSWMSKKNILNPPFGKLFRNNLIRDFNIRYDEDLALGEDFCFNLDYLNHINSGTILCKELYFYRDTSGSLSKNIRGDYADIQMKLFDRNYDFTFRNNINYPLKTNAILRDTFLSLCRCCNPTEEKIASLNKLKTHKMMTLSNKFTSLKDYIVISSIKYLPSSILLKIF